MMLELSKIDEIAAKAANDVLKPARFSRLFTEQTADQDGQDALAVTVVLKDEGYLSVTGDLALDTLVKINRDLNQAGEDRFAIVSYATEEEMADDTELDDFGEPIA